MQAGGVVNRKGGGGCVFAFKSLCSCIPLNKSFCFIFNNSVTLLDKYVEQIYAAMMKNTFTPPTTGPAQLLELVLVAAALQ